MAYSPRNLAVDYAKTIENAINLLKKKEEEIIAELTDNLIKNIDVNIRFEPLSEPEISISKSYYVVSESNNSQ